MINRKEANLIASDKRDAIIREKIAEHKINCSDQILKAALKGRFRIIYTLKATIYFNAISSQFEEILVNNGYTIGHIDGFNTIGTIIVRNYYISWGKNQVIEPLKG